MPPVLCCHRGVVGHGLVQLGAVAVYGAHVMVHLPVLWPAAVGGGGAGTGARATRGSRVSGMQRYTRGVCCTRTRGQRRGACPTTPPQPRPGWRTKGGWVGVGKRAGGTGVQVARYLVRHGRCVLHWWLPHVAAGWRVTLRRAVVLRRLRYLGRPRVRRRVLLCWAETSRRPKHTFVDVLVGQRLAHHGRCVRLGRGRGEGEPATTTHESGVSLHTHTHTHTHTYRAGVVQMGPRAGRGARAGA